MLVDLIRKIVPIKYRQSLGLWTAHQASRSKLLLYPYYYMLCGTVPRNLTMLKGDKCIINYKNNGILSPRDGIFTSWEVLQDEIYEKVYHPNLSDVVIDIGAYVGMFTVKASQQVGHYGKVIAIEPSSTNLEYLRQNTKALSNVLVVPMAAGSKSSCGNLTISEASPCHTLSEKANSITERVKIDTLDNILYWFNLKKVNFIKIDAEGAELEILKGATKTLTENQLHLAIASYHNLPTGEYELPIIKKYLLDLGFKVTIIKEYIYANNWRNNG